MEIAIGVLIGLAIGATGVGGGTLTAPALILLMGYTPRGAVATALVFSAAIKVFASGTYLFRGNVDFRIFGYLICGGAPGALLGAFALERLRVARANQWILCAIGIVVMISAVGNIVNFRRNQRASISTPYLLPLFCFPIGLEAGFSSSGSGALGTTLLFRVTTLSPAVIVGTDLVFGLTVSAIAGGVHAYSGACDWRGLARLIPAGILGSLIGVHICTILSAKTLRQVIMIFAAGIGFSLLVRGLEGIL
jgi:uncharacterized membrane protein YfcA